MPGKLHLYTRPETREAALTGRFLSPTQLSPADYVTQIQKIKHPYDRGISARKGIEF